MEILARNAERFLLVGLSPGLHEPTIYVTEMGSNG